MVRVKYRYLLVEVICADSLEQNHKKKLPLKSINVKISTDEAIKSMLGDYGCGMLLHGFNVLQFNPYTRIACIRAKRGPHRLLSMVLPYINKIAGTRCFLRTLHLSGTLRSANKFLQRYYFHNLASLLRKCKTDEDRLEVQESIKSCEKPTWKPREEGIQRGKRP